MTNEVFVAVLAFLGTIIGTVGGILAGSKLTEYRLVQIEKKLDEYKELNSRIYALERHDEVLDTRLKSIEDRINQRFDDMQDRQSDFMMDMREAMNGGKS